MSIVRDITDNDGNIQQITEIGTDGQLYVLDMSNSIRTYDYVEPNIKGAIIEVLKEILSEANELEDPKYILETSELPLDVDGTVLPLETYALQCYCRGGEEVIDIIEKKINELRGKDNGK